MNKLNRRHFLRISSISGGGVLLSTLIPLSCSTKQADPDPFEWEPNFFIRIDTDNQITFSCSQSELGQGTSVGLSMIVADELGAKLEDLNIVFAEGSEEKFDHLQDTGGSNGLRMLWGPLREAAATTREILLEAAAQKWVCDKNQLYTEDGKVWHKNNDQSIEFGQLLDMAKDLVAPDEVSLKDKKDFKYIGRSVQSRKSQEIIRGRLPYSIDVQLPGMVYAAIQRCPVWKGSLLSFDDAAARAIPGVLDVIEMEPTELQAMDYRGGVRPGVAVIAENTWAAFEGKKALEIQWDLGPNAGKTENDLRKELENSKNNTQQVTYDIKDAQQAYRRGKSFLEARYESPFQVNACMEPLNAVADHKGYKVEIWAGTQAPQLTRDRIAELTELPPAAITVHNQPSGGGFGRRYFVDYVEEAVILSDIVKRPVKVTWSREDTIGTNKYHPFRTEYWSAALDERGYPLALSHHGVVERPNGFRPYPYGLPAVFHKWIDYQNGNLLPRASWRSVAAHPWGLGLECFIDELAEKAGRDPVQFRLELLDKAEIVPQKFHPWVGDDLYPKKLKRTLEVAAEKAGWGKSSGSNVFQGVSSFAYNTSYCSQIAEVSVNNDQLNIHKVTAVIDCGLAVNPSQVKAQIEGSIIWGLGALLKEPIRVSNGAVIQQNFHEYELMRMQECPEIEVHIIESEDPPSGTGEPAVPGIAPAVLNAVYAATGRRYRTLPFSLTQQNNS